MAKELLFAAAPLLFNNHTALSTLRKTAESGAMAALWVGLGNQEKLGTVGHPSKFSLKMAAHQHHLYKATDAGFAPPETVFTCPRAGPSQGIKS